MQHKKQEKENSMMMIRKKEMWFKATFAVYNNGDWRINNGYGINCKYYRGVEREREEFGMK